MSEPRNICRTWTGRIININHVTPDDIRIQDIAVGLSNVCRFAGQLPPGTFLSVLHHSLVVEALARRAGHGPKRRLRALLHDAAEAYTSDIPSPFKRQLKGYDLIEQRFLRAIFAKFIGSNSAAMPKWLKRLDDAALQLERRAFSMYPGGTAADVAFESVPQARLLADFYNRFNELHALVKLGQPLAIKSSTRRLITEVMNEQAPVLELLND